ncbi:hypothetical protein [Aliidongia dinghuensis]|nr:hypothetical protein [Aliidongia dinghuensis]
MGSHFSAVWHPGTGAQWWAARVSFDQFKALDQKHFDDGLRLSALQVDSDGNHSAVWRTGMGAQHWQTGMTRRELKVLDNQLFASSQRLVRVDTINGIDSNDGWYAVWRPGTGAQCWRTGLTAEEFEQQDAEFFVGGLRLCHMRHDARGSGKFLGLWRPGTGAQHWLAQNPVDLAQFARMNAQHEVAGERLVALPHHGLNAIWRSGSGPAPFVFATDLASFKAADAELFNRGFRLAHFSTGAAA